MKGLLPSFKQKEDAESDQPLLKEEPPLEESSTLAAVSKWRLPSWQKIFNTLSILYIMVSMPALLTLLQPRASQPYSPVSSRLTHERQPLHEEHEALKLHGYVGRPEDTEKNWRRLLEPMNFKATQEELERSNIDINEKVVRVSGGGYVGVLSVYHELHCLEALRRSTLRTYYYPNMTKDHDDGTIEHLTHCIEYIRRTVMCHADVSVYTATWIADSHEHPNKDLVSGVERVCVNWDSIDAWSRQRALETGVYKVKPGPFEKDLHPNGS